MSRKSIGSLGAKVSGDFGTGYIYAISWTEPPQYDVMTKSGLIKAVTNIEVISRSIDDEMPDELKKWLNGKQETMRILQIK